MLRAIVLGAGAGGGVPQWNCGCRICHASRGDQPELRSTQTSVAISADGTNWFLINASPDLRAQLNATPQLHPKPGALRHTPIAGVILTNGEVDAVAGLLSMREGSPFTIYAHPRVLAILKSNSIFNVLSEKNVRREPVAIDHAFEPTLPDGSPSGLSILPLEVPGKAAWYLEGQPGSDGIGDTLGLRIEHKASGDHLYVITACAEVTEAIRDRIRDAPLVLFDGTVWRDDELIAAGLGNKTGKGMGHIAMDGDHGAIASLADLGIGQKIFLHVNNSNPALLRHSAERRVLEAAGWKVAADGMEVTS